MSAAQLARMARSALAAAAARSPEARTDCSPVHSARRRSRSGSGGGTDVAGGGGGGSGMGFGPQPVAQYPGSEGRRQMAQRRGHKRDEAVEAAAAVAAAGQTGSSWRQKAKVARVLGFTLSASHDGPLLPPLPPAAPSSPRAVFARVVGSQDEPDNRNPSTEGERSGGSGSAARTDPGASVSFGGWGEQQAQQQQQQNTSAIAAESERAAGVPTTAYNEADSALRGPAAGIAEHLNCEPPTSGVGAGPGAACADGGGAAVGGLQARSVEDAACLYYLRKLARKAFQVRLCRRAAL